MFKVITAPSCLSVFFEMWYLGDFGWAVMRDDLSMQNPDGAGSLWYAPPELNPPVEGVFCKPGALF